MVYENSVNKLIYIVGPTASGKTELALKLAKEIGGEIIGADSMQIYKYISIGTAKPTKEETGDCKYHFIDFVEPNEIYTVSQFKDQALDKIYELHNKGIIPIICGGTGLYINSLLYKMEFTGASYDLKLRKDIEAMSSQEQLEMLKQLDEETYKSIDKNNPRRVIRAIEICRLSGVPKSEQTGNYKQHLRHFDHRVIVLSPQRQKLYDKINKRVDVMMELGLENEVRMLMEKYPDSNYPIFQFIGYKEMLEYIRGKADIKTAIENMKRNTRRFAKRQLTWFRGITGIEHLYWLDSFDDRNALFQKVMEICK